MSQNVSVEPYRIKFYNTVYILTQLSHKLSAIEPFMSPKRRGSRLPRSEDGQRT